MICFSSRLSVVPRLLFLSFDMQNISSATLEVCFWSISCKTGSLTCSGYTCTCRDSLHWFKLLLHFPLSPENIQQPRRLEPELIQTNNYSWLFAWFYTFIMFISLYFSQCFYFMKGYFVLNTVLMICHIQFKDTRWTQYTEVIFLGQNKFRTVLYPLIWDHIKLVLVHYLFILWIYTRGTSNLYRL